MRKNKNEQVEVQQALQPAGDEQLFQALGKNKKRKRRKIIRTVITVILVLAVLLGAGVMVLRKRVQEQFASSAADVKSHTVSAGTISTVVSGSGTLADVDTETVAIPQNVEVTEILVSAKEAVAEGDLLAVVDMAGVHAAMSELQETIEDLDEQISEAEDDKVSSKVKARVDGRVKRILAKKNKNVADVMAGKGALLVLSLDGKMAVDISTDALKVGDSVKVVRENGKKISGKVDAVSGGVATILVTDNGPKYNEEVTVKSGSTELGTGKLYIHNPLAVTGYAGKIKTVKVELNEKVSAGDTLFTLKSTKTSVNYDALLRQRRDAEEQLLELLQIQRNGGIVSPITGSVYSVGDLESEENTDVAVISPDKSMSVTVSVDETDILSLEVGQSAEITVSSVSDEAFTGTVTEIDTSMTSGAYTAQVILDKVTGMLPGMTASVDVRIEGVDDALLIPVDALNKTAETTYVYTTYNEQTQEYGGKRDVVIGLQNSQYVEIKSGLSAGETVCYTEKQDFRNMFGGMNFGGGMPNMGGGNSGMPNFGGGNSGMPNMGGGNGQRPGGNGGSSNRGNRKN